MPSDATSTKNETDEASATRLLDLGNGLAVWRVPLSRVREQDKNARYLEPHEFKLLLENVKKDQRLESLPFCMLTDAADGKPEFLLISGHQRSKVARAAGLGELHLLVEERTLSHSQMRSKQLAHNALAGKDDPQILAELYAEIDNVADKIASGIHDVSIETEAVSIDDTSLELGFELLSVLFMPRQLNVLEQALKLIDPTGNLWLADMESWQKFVDAARQVTKNDGVRAASAVMTRMAEVVIAYYENLPEQTDVKKVDEEPEDIDNAEPV
jgi:hypothetical protein